MLKVSNADLFTPANAVTAAGVILTFIGALSLNTLHGFIIAGTGKALDMVDGPIARRTHTSHFGALFDAGSDKFTSVVLLFSAYHFKLAPVAFLLFVLLYHLAVLGLSLDAEAHGIETKPTRLGKNTMFLHIGAILLFALAKAVSGAHDVVYTLAAVFAIAGIAAGAISLGTYIEIYNKKVRAKSHK